MNHSLTTYIYYYFVVIIVHFLPGKSLLTYKTMKEMVNNWLLKLQQLIAFANKIKISW